MNSVLRLSTLALCIVLLLSALPSQADPRFGSLKLTSVPDSAVVVLDGSLQGRAPMDVPMITPGKHQLVVFKNGFKTYDRMLTFECGKRLVGHVKLEPLPLDADAPAADDSLASHRAQEDIPAKDDTNDVLQEPVMTSHPQLKLPEAYLAQHSGGYYYFNLLVDENGSILIAEMLNGNDLLLDRDVMTAVRKWKFKPAVGKNGKPCKMWIPYSYQITISYW